MPHAEANGQRLYYEVAGPPDAEPLLLVMGLSADRLSWLPQLEPFASQFRVVSFDNRDVGQSSYADSPYSIADMAADTLALADFLELDSFHLVGVSMGGAISQEVALAAGDRVLSLTLCVTWGGSGPWGEWLTRVWGPQVLRSTREEHVDHLLLRCFSEEFFEKPDMVDFMRNAMLANPHPQAPEAFVRQLTACGRHETRSRLGSLAMPVHVVAAEHDQLVPPWKAAELASLIPGARHSAIPGGAHMANLERAEEFNELVLGFIAEHALVAR
jgi:3-oxoadipate enol-lactonase